MVGNINKYQHHYKYQQKLNDTVKVVTRFLGAKVLYIIVVIKIAQNYYTKGAENNGNFSRIQDT